MLKLKIPASRPNMIIHQKIVAKFLQYFGPPVERVKAFVLAKLESGASSKYTENLLQAIPFWVGSLIVGIVAVIYAKLFRIAEDGTLYATSLWIIFPVLLVSLISGYAACMKGNLTATMVSQHSFYGRLKKQYLEDVEKTRS